MRRLNIALLGQEQQEQDTSALNTEETIETNVARKENDNGSEELEVDKILAEKDKPLNQPTP